jgi:hypothetical protein
LLAETLVRRERVRVEELAHGLENRVGQMRSVVEYRLRLDYQALELCKELGVTPASRARLGLDLARTTQAVQSVDVSDPEKRAALAELLRGRPADPDGRPGDPRLTGGDR